VVGRPTMARQRLQVRCIDESHLYVFHTEVTSARFRPEHALLAMGEVLVVLVAG